MENKCEEKSIWWLLGQIYHLFLTIENRTSYLKVLVFEVLAVALIVFQGFAPGYLLDSLKESGFWSTILQAGIIGVVCVLAEWYFTWMRRHYREIVTMDIRDNIDAEIQRLYSLLPMKDHITEGVSKRFSLVEKGRPALDHVLSIMAFTGTQLMITILLAACALFVLNRPVALFVICSTCGVGFYLSKCHSLIVKQDRPLEREYKRYNSWFKEILRQMAMVQLYGREKTESEIRNQKYGVWLEKDRKLWLNFYRLITIGDGLMMTGVYYAVVVICLWQVDRGYISLGMAIPSLLWSRSLCGNANMLSEMFSQLLRQNTYGVALLQELLKKTDVSEEVKEDRIGEIQKIEFKNVSFAYPDGGRILLGVNVTFEAGKLTALVGETGSGKTTLTKLLMRADDVTSGQILINGKDIRYTSLYSFRTQMALVAQNPLPWDGTLRDNLLKPHANGYCPSDEDLFEVLALCGLDIRGKNKARFKLGLNTKVGEDGIFLSGGEKQRLMIATAVLSGKRFIIFDEPTSALDPETEKVIKTVFNSLTAKGIGIIVIAHRLSTIREADQMCVLTQAHCIPEGRAQLMAYTSYNEALEEDEIFQALHKASEGE